MVRIATFNVNGVNGRLPVLLKWLTATTYDIVCLQELKTSDEKFPAEAIREAGYGDLAWPEILQRSGHFISRDGPGRTPARSARRSR